MQDKMSCLLRVYRTIAPKLVMRKRNSPIASSSKRGLDLGLGRGYSGSQAAKHLMGLAAANFAGGPGRRRRSDDSA
ncbi:hypothetical protein QE152_g3858 [Popillia japonica]|uniref:Diuretic hormone class 2 n=1 Tax=Popillia japonica TaxID=7064 RepID=A0AAW1N2G5_POPJA